MSTPSTPNGIFTNPAVASAVDADLWGGILNSNFNIADTQTTTRAYDLNFADFLLSRPVLKDYGELYSTPASAANVLTLDVTNGNHFAVSLTESVTTLTISNTTATGKICAIELWLKQNATGNWTFTWPSSIKWAGGTTPVVTATANATDIFVLQTKDGGTTFAGSIVGQNFTGL
jgi:hypothetical protein